MKSKQIHFFATRIDLKELTVDFESILNIKYVGMGLFDSNEVLEYMRLSDVPDIGFTKFGAWMSLDHRYMVVAEDKKINVRIVPQKKGGTKYAIDPMANPDSIELSTGGIFSENGKVLVAGRLATASGSEFSVRTYMAFVSRIRKVFRKNGTFYIGEDAHNKLVSGWRLVTNVNSPIEYDLKKEIK